MEEQTIRHAQHLDLIYSQSSMLYNLTLNGSHSKPGPHIDGVVGYASSTTIG